jgi:Fe-S cluster assembly protein SufD
MISEAIKTESDYRSAFRTLQSSRSAARQASWIERLRESAMDQFETLGFPSVTDEEWRYTNVSGIARGGFVPSAARSGALTEFSASDLEQLFYDESRKSTLVFVNGSLRAELSSLSALPPEVAAIDLGAALQDQQFSDVLKEHLGRHVEYDENGFTALNTAFLATGALVLIPRNVEVKSALHLLFITTADAANAAVFPRVLVVAEENSSATIIESYVGLGDEASFTNAVVEIAVKDGARLDHYRVQNESAAAFHITTTRADLGRDSGFNTTSIALGAQLSRHNLSVIMDHEGAECAVDGLYIVGTGQHADTHSVIDHKRPRCKSHQLYKGILDGKSRAVFNGKVFVREGAMGTDAIQTNKNLLLSNEAQVDTKPQLEIFADDVKCAHGAAIGQLSEDELFYLASRGIHNDLARNLLTYGFAEEVIARIKIDSIRAQLDETVLNRLHARLEA